MAFICAIYFLFVTCAQAFSGVRYTHFPILNKPGTSTETHTSIKLRGRSTNEGDVTLSSSPSWNHISLLPPAKLTVLLPAYNEESRIGETIIEYGAYLAESSIWGRDGGKWCDVLVVNDGSTDETVYEVRKCADRIKDVKIRCLSLDQNEGKGSAVSKGIEAIHKLQKLDNSNDDGDNPLRSHVILVADADGSGDILYLNSMIRELSNLVIGEVSGGGVPWETKAMIVGNRDGNTSISRVVTRWGFRTLVKLICGDLQVGDTQCGFKLMTFTGGLELYSELNLKRWTHDVEVLYRAKKLSIPAREMKIGWVDKAGSKLANTVIETIYMSGVMLSEIIFMRFQYIIGAWSVR